MLEGWGLARFRELQAGKLEFWMKPWILFSFSAALFWGCYVPTIFYGQTAFGAGNPNRSMKAFLFVGIAYFVMAIVVPGVWIWTHASPADQGWPSAGIWLSLIAGVLGAAGALSVVFALRDAGAQKPPLIAYVAPIVFAGAPIINVLFSWLIDLIKGHARAPHPMFLVGLVLAITGVVIVLLFNPAAHKPQERGPATGPASSSSLPAGPPGK